MRWPFEKLLWTFVTVIIIIFTKNLLIPLETLSQKAAMALHTVYEKSTLASESQTQTQPYGKFSGTPGWWFLQRCQQKKTDIAKTVPVYSSDEPCLSLTDTDKNIIYVY